MIRTRSRRRLAIAGIVAAAALGSAGAAPRPPRRPSSATRASTGSRRSSCEIEAKRGCDEAVEWWHGALARPTTTAAWSEMAVTDIDEAKLEAFVGHVATEIGAAVNAALVLIGDELGLFRAMADGQPVSSGRAGRPHRHAGALRARVARPPRRRAASWSTARPATCCRPSTRSCSPTTRARSR